MYSNTVNVLNLNEKPELILTAKDGDVVQVSFFEFIVSVKSSWSGDRMHLTHRDSMFSSTKFGAGDKMKYLSAPNGAITMSPQDVLHLLKTRTFNIV